MENKDDAKPKILVGHADDGPLPEGIIHVPGRGVDEPVRVDREVQVVTDPQQVAAARNIHEAEVSELFDAAIDAVEEGGFLFSEHLWVLKSRQSRGESVLRAMMNDGDKSAVARTKAAHVLIQMGDSTGEDFLFAALASPDADLRSAALKMLGEWGIDVDFTRDDRPQRLTAMMQDQDGNVRKQAADLCVRKELAGTEQQLVRLIEAAEIDDLAAASLDLGRIATRPESVEVMLKHLFKNEDTEYDQWIGTALRDVLGNANPEVSEPVRQALHAYTLKLKSERYDQSLVGDLAATAKADSLPVLEDILANAKDPVSQLYALEAIARLQPESAVERILGFIAADGASRMAIDMLAEHAKPSDADRVIPVVVPEAGEISESVLLDCLGDPGRQAIESVRDRLEPSAEMWAYWKLEGIDLRTALEDLKELGIGSGEPAAVLIRMQTRKKEYGDEAFDMSDPYALFWALGETGHLLGFDAETGMLPCNHHRLLLQFSEAAQGAFEIEAPSELWHRQNEDDYDAPYTVQFIRDGKLYRFGAENYGDWYDVEAVHNAVNDVLADAGCEERFIALESDGQLAYFFFARPADFLPFANKYRLPLSDDATEAMKKGMEYEAKVMERLKGEE